MSAVSTPEGIAVKDKHPANDSGRKRWSPPRIILSSASLNTAHPFTTGASDAFNLDAHTPS